MLVLALALLFSGCDNIQRLFGELYGVDDGPDGNGLAGGGRGGGNAEPAPEEPGNVPNGYVAQGKPVPNAANNPSIKEKSGVNATGTEGVTKAFLELSEFIRNGNFEDDLKHQKKYQVIQLGDYIDLEGGLTVAAYPDGGVFLSGDPALCWDADITVQKGDGQQAEPRGKMSRLIVVGINSFNNVNSNNTPHVVFQFQNIPVTRRMNKDASNAGGYPASEMREYLTPVTQVDGSGNFLTGLENAGVPEEVLRGPSRTISTKDGTTTINDLLWLPTIWEMTGKAGDSYLETEGNQARLEYYYSSTSNGDSLRQKTASVPDIYYWLASASDSSTRFCVAQNDGNMDADYSAANVIGVAPAFCVY
jgi:hypothetical protein